MHRSEPDCGARRTVSAITTAISAVPIPVRGGRRGSGSFRNYPSARLTFENFALIRPALDANHAIGGVGLRETVIDIGAQRVQRKLALQIPFAARDFGAVQAPGHANFDSLAAEPQRGIDRFAHRTAERHALFQLQRDRFGHQLRVEFRLMNFLNVDEDFALGLLGQILLQLFDLGARACR